MAEPRTPGRREERERTVALGEVFLRACAEHGDRVAVVGGAERLTYAEFARRATARSAALDSSWATPGWSGCTRPTAWTTWSPTTPWSSAADCRSWWTPRSGRSNWRDPRRLRVDAYLTATPDRFPLKATVTPVPDSGLSSPRPPSRAGRRCASRIRPPPPAGSPRHHRCPKCLEFSHTAVHSAARNWAEGTGLTPADRVLCLAAFTNGLAFNTSLLSVFLTGAQLHLHQGPPTSGAIVRRSAGPGRPAWWRSAGVPAARRGHRDRARRARRAEAGGVRRGRARPVRTGRVRGALPGARRRLLRHRRDRAVHLRAGPGVDRRSGHPAARRHAADRRTPSGEPEIQVRTASMATRYLNAPAPCAHAPTRRATTPRGHRLPGGGPGAHHRPDLRTHQPGGPQGRPDGDRAGDAGAGRVRDSVCFADTDARGETVLHLVLSGGHCPERAEVVRACRDGLAPTRCRGGSPSSPRSHGPPPGRSG
ncbi:hypothetical protein NKH77_48410 [Streptomyces sp. M19]